MTNDKMSTSPLDARGVRGVVEAIQKSPPKHFRYLIGIDGLGASGKSTIAHELASMRKDISVIHVDEFYLPKSERSAGIIEGQAVSPDFDWDRLDGQVFQAVARGLLVKYQRYDWRADVWGEWIEIPESNWIIIVGVYALQSRFFPYYDYSIWCEVPKEIRMKRMIEREGKVVAKEWEAKWLPREENYLVIEGPDKRVSIVLQ